MADTRRWVWLGGIVLLCVFVFLLHSILTPFLVALLLAYLFDPVVDRLEKAGLSRTLGVVAVFALFTLIITALVLVLVLYSICALRLISISDSPVDSQVRSPSCSSLPRENTVSREPV